MLSNSTTNVLLVGVGGQGVMLASEILALVAAEEGFDVKQTEVHGASQRGGAVSSHVRYGPKVHSPVIGRGCADFLVAYEKLEALRCAHYLKDGGTIVLNEEEILPPATGSDRLYPAHVIEFLESKGFEVIAVQTKKLAMGMGEPRVANIIVLGVLAQLLSLRQESWLEVLKKRIPTPLLDINTRAFLVGTSLE